MMTADDQGPLGQQQSASNEVHAPSIEMPKGGGAIRGIGEKPAANSVTGTSTMAFPIATTPAPQVPAVPGDVVYGTGRMDESGRVADRAMIGALGWQPGDRLTFTAVAGVVIARRDPAGMVTMPAKPYLVILAALRRRCGLRPGDHLLLAASPGEDKLTAYSFAVVDQALRAHALVPGEGRQP